MKKISSIIQNQDYRDGLPIRGVNGYGGEQDGDRVILSDFYRFESRDQADRRFPGGIPDYVHLHWAVWIPYHYWECVFGWWRFDADESDEKNPLRIL